MTEAMKNLQNLGQQRKFTKMIIVFLASFYQELPKKGVLSELNVVLMDKMINLYSSEIQFTIDDYKLAAVKTWAYKLIVQQEIGIIRNSLFNLISIK